jgi:hypothetical protein
MSENNGSPPKFGIRKNVKLVGRMDTAGGGQVVVENGYATPATWICRTGRSQRSQEPQDRREIEILRAFTRTRCG